ncbi:hypothetical protein MDA_GLEAN10017269 [Myotis davidii]|uniref:Uncharacterized protein n=1 Tax=Myotis davidii TaxID=225400 RepID=L5MH70_MYODS|nr:hypothetical protein MDA_GLEAN10017269 [Myotis davidii]
MPWPAELTLITIRSLITGSVPCPGLRPPAEVSGLGRAPLAPCGYRLWPCPGLRPLAKSLGLGRGPPAPCDVPLCPCPGLRPLAESSCPGSGDPQRQRPHDRGLHFRPRQGTPGSRDCQL